MFRIVKYLSILVLFSAVCESKDIRYKIVIDQDGGADDALAIFMALMNERYFNGPQVVGLTTTHGNVNESQVFINTQRILNIGQRKDIPIYRGCATPFISAIESDYFFGRDGLGDNEVEDYDELPAQPLHAALALIDLSKIYEGQLIVVAIGSMTNIGLAIKLDPEFLSRLAQLYVGAGHIHNSEFPEAEFNAAMDPEAYDMIANVSTVPQVTIVPFSPIRTYVQIDKSWRINVLGGIPTVLMGYQNKFERLSLAAAEYWTLLDPAVMAVALQESIVTQWKTSLCSIYLCGKDRGVTPHDFHSKTPNTRVALMLNKEKYMEFLFNLFSAPLGYFDQFLD